jgi:hypothetical protein
MPRTPGDVAASANRIMTAIDEDIASGAIPASVRSFTDLQRYTDTTVYLDRVGVLDDCPQAGRDLTTAVQDEVTRRLSDPNRRWCTAGTCRYPSHDHTTTVGPNGEDLDQPIPMLCDHCRQPVHYDENLHTYRHDNPTAPACFLIH